MVFVGRWSLAQFRNDKTLFTIYYAWLTDKILLSVISTVKCSRDTNLTVEDYSGYTSSKPVPILVY